MKEELNAAANLSVWKGIMPELNIAARLGRPGEKERERKRKGQSESCISIQKRCFYSKICFLKLCARGEAERSTVSAQTSLYVLTHFMHSFDFLCIFN